MENRLRELEKLALLDIKAVSTQQEFEMARAKYLGRKGAFSVLYKELAACSPQERPALGQKLNKLKSVLEEEFKNKANVLSRGSCQARQDTFDATMPGICPLVGKTHLITKTIDDICGIFSCMGFGIVEGPEIENEFNNFEALNIPLDHPSREAFDTFYLDTENFGSNPQARRLLRSHTSPMQIRYMLEHKPPFSIAVPGKVFRPDATDASHSFMFHQVEGLMVADNINFANLKWILFEFARKCFGSAVQVRFRPHFFPFTEPSAEVDVSCIICQGRGCRVCSQSGWLEILGSGMVDPNVFKAVGIDSDKFSGFAFGMGVERIAMLKHGIDDIRLFYENDLRFLGQF
ncbi:MAG: phenylalanine--tRNA ligase subunit alpha [Candidatus Omnitrophica bacterium]|nr:phenylalanine--tRNA ligase subunit alpha [Candidatus Omnitrophota bacterium]